MRRAIDSEVKVSPSDALNGKKCVGRFKHEVREVGLVHKVEVRGGGVDCKLAGTLFLQESCK